MKLRHFLFFIILLGSFYLANKSLEFLKFRVYAQYNDIFPIDQRWTLLFQDVNITSKYPIIDYIRYPVNVSGEWKFFVSYVQNTPEGSVVKTVIYSELFDSGALVVSNPFPSSDLRYATVFSDGIEYYYIGLFRINGKTYGLLFCTFRGVCYNIQSSPSNVDRAFNRPVGLWYDIFTRKLYVFFLMYADNPQTTRIDIGNYLVIDEYIVDLETVALNFVTRRVLSVPFEVLNTYRVVFFGGPTIYFYEYVSGAPDNLYVYKDGQVTRVLSTNLISIGKSLGDLVIYYLSGGYWHFYFKEPLTFSTKYYARISTDFFFANCPDCHVLLIGDSMSSQNLQYELGRKVVGLYDPRGLIYGISSFMFFGISDKNVAFSFRTDDLTRFLERDLAYLTISSVNYHPSYSIIEVKTSRGIYYVLAYKAGTDKVEVRYYFAIPIYISIHSPEEGRTYYLIPEERIPVNITIEDPLREISRVEVYISGVTCEKYQGEIPIVLYNGTYQRNIVIEDISQLIVPLNPGKLYVSVYDSQGRLLVTRTTTFYVIDPKLTVKYYPSAIVEGYTGETIQQVFELIRPGTCGEDVYYYIDILVDNPNVSITTSPYLPGIYLIRDRLNITLNIYSKVQGIYNYTIIANHTDSPYFVKFEGAAIIKYRECNLSLYYPDGTTTKSFEFYVNKTNVIPIIVENVGNISCSFYIAVDIEPTTVDIIFPEGDAIFREGVFYSPIEYSLTPGEKLFINITTIPQEERIYTFTIYPTSDRYNLRYNNLTGTINAIIQTCNAEITLYPETLSLWTYNTANLTLTITNLGNTECTYDLGISCPAGVSCLIYNPVTPKLRFGESFTTIVSITPVERGTFNIYAIASARETGEKFVSNNVTIISEEPVQIEILSPTAQEIHQTSVLIHVSVKNLTKVTNPLTRIFLNDNLLYETTEPTFEYKQEVNITEGVYELKIIFTSEEYTITKRFSFYNDLIKYVRILQPEPNKIYNLTDPIPIDVEAELWVPLTNATLLIFIDGLLYKEIPIIGLYTRYTTEVLITQPGLHIVYAMVISKEAKEVSPYVFFSIGMPPDYPVYNITFREINYNDLEKIYKAWKLIYKEINYNDLEKIIREYVTKYLAVEDNKEIEKLVRVYLTQFREINDNDLRKIFVVWLIRTLTIEDNNLSKIFKEYLITTKNISVNDLYKIFKEYGVSDIKREDNNLRKIFAEWIIKSLEYNTNDLNKIFSEFITRLREYSMNPYTGIIHEIKIYPINFLEININDLFKIFEEYEVSEVAVEQNPFDIFRVHVAKFLEVGFNFLKKIFGVFETILRFGQMNPLNVIGYVGTEEPYIKLITQRVPACNAIIEYEAVMPETKEPYYYTIELSINGLTFCKQTWYYTFIARGLCTLEGYYPGNYSIEARLERYRLVDTYFERDLEKVDTAQIQIVHEPFIIEIREPQAGLQIYTGDKVNLSVYVRVPEYDGMRYTMIIKIFKDSIEIGNYTEFIEPGTRREYRYELIFNVPGTYYIEAMLDGYCIPLGRTVDSKTDSVSLTVLQREIVQPVPPPAPAPTPAVPPEVVEVPTRPPVEIIPVAVPEEERVERPPGVQTVVEIFRENPWLILVILLIIALTIYMMRKE